MHRTLGCVLAGLIIGSAQVVAADEAKVLPPPTAPTASSAATLFLPGLISQAGFDLHSSPSFAPDGAHAFFAVKDNERLVDGRPLNVVLWIRQQAGAWATPEVAPFSGQFDDRDPRIARGGQRVYFSSTRPISAGDAPRSDHDIWFAERAGSGWGEPRHLHGPVNSDAREGSVSIAPDGSMFFTRRLDRDAGWSEIFRAPLVDGGFGEPQPVAAVNTPGYEAFPLLTPSGRALVFYARDRAQGPGQYVSFLDVDGEWGEPVSLGDVVNLPEVAFCASFSADGDRLLFLRRGDSEAFPEGIYEVDSAILAHLRWPQ